MSIGLSFAMAIMQSKSQMCIDITAKMDKVVRNSPLSEEIISFTSFYLRQI